MADPTPADSEARLRELVEKTLAPMVAVDRGVLEWVGLHGDVAEIRLGGSCAGCPGQSYTVQHVLLPALQTIVPAIRVLRVKPLF